MRPVYRTHERVRVFRISPKQVGPSTGIPADLVFYIFRLGIARDHHNPGFRACFAYRVCGLYSELLVPGIYTNYRHLRGHALGESHRHNRVISRRQKLDAKGAVKLIGQLLPQLFVRSHDHDRNRRAACP